jgi:hypothetical protein
VVVSLGYVLWIIMVIAACLAIYYLDILQRDLKLNVGLPTATPEAHITPGELSNGDKIFEDHFGNSSNDWTSYQRNTQFSTQDGKLALSSTRAKAFAAVSCIKCITLDQPYYFQTELATDTATATTYGILFRSGSFYPNLFYVYLINAKDQEYFLYSYAGDSWALHTSGKTLLIENYPYPNTLGVYVRDDSLEMYINGNRVDTYQESNISFLKGYFGFYIDDSGPQLSVQNVLIYAIR